MTITISLFALAISIWALSLAKSPREVVNCAACEGKGQNLNKEVKLPCPPGRMEGMVSMYIRDIFIAYYTACAKIQPHICPSCKGSGKVRV